LTRLEGDGELAIHAAIPRRHSDLCRGVFRDVQPDVARMRDQLVSPGGVNEAVERDVATRRLTANELCRHSAKVDIAADRSDLDAATDISEANASADRPDLHVGRHVTADEITRERVDIEARRHV